MSVGRWRVRVRVRVRVVVALLLFLVPAVHRAQTTGDIQGRVSDSAGGALHGVAVEATSPSLQGARTAVTDKEGEYRFPATPPGGYRIRAAISGFHAEDRTATVSLSATATVDFILHPAAEERVVVSGETPTIDVSSTTTGTTYTFGVISGLPVGRNYADIVKANPGVDTDRGDTQGRSLAITIYGATSAESQWIIDGVNTTNVFKGVQGKAINNEFVEEVEVKTGGYQAEYGRALGGVINVITKSGGNTFHGDGFVYYDSSDTAAQQQFGPDDSGITSMRVDDGTRVDYGVDLGGYLLKDRLWFFGAYNRVNLDGHVSRVESSTYVSSADQFPFDGVDNLYSGKLTWNVSPATALVGTVFADPSSTSGAAGADPRQGLGSAYVRPPVSLDPSTWYSTRVQGGTDFGLRLTQLFGSQAVATAQGSYHQDKNSLEAADTIRYVDWTCTGGTPDSRCPFPPEPNSITGGYGQGAGHGASTREQYAASANLYSGNHEVKAGGDYWDGRTDIAQLITGGQLVQKFNEWGQTYYSHRYFAVSQTDPTILPVVDRGARVIDYGAYLQDTWRVSQGLTVDLGLRWDGERTINTAGEAVLQFHDEWQPRIGVVWDPWRDGATKVYAFAGRFFYALPTVAAATSFGKLTSLQSFNFDPVSVEQAPNVPHHPNRTGGGGTFASLVDAGVTATYQDEFTVGVERALSPTLVVGLKGTYRSLGNALEDRCDVDYSQPENNQSDCALLNPGSNGRYASGQFPVCDGLYESEAGSQCTPTGPATPEARRIYRGIELLARQTVGNRLWLQASYVYSSLRGNYDGGVNEGSYGQTSPGINSDFNWPALWYNAYGALALDRPHRFRFDGAWVTPLSLSVGLQAFVESGGPLNQLGYFNGGGGIFLVPRGSAGSLPTTWEGNLKLGYPISIGPVTATLEACVFNLFNNQIATSRDEDWTVYAPPDYPASLYDPNQPSNNPNYGKITSRQEPRRFRAAVRVSF